MTKITFEQIVTAIEAKAENGTITTAALKTVTSDLYMGVLAQAETDAAHDAALVAEIRELQKSYPVLRPSGVSAASLQAIIAQRQRAEADHAAAVNEDIAQKQAWRAVIFGSIEAGATVAIGGGNPLAVGAALIPAFNATQEIARAMGITIIG